MPRKSGQTTTERILRLLALAGDPERAISEGRLGPTQEAAVRALVYDGLSTREIAEALGISAPRVHEALQRALEHLEAVVRE